MLPEFLRRFLGEGGPDDSAGDDDPARTRGAPEITTRYVEFRELLREHDGRLKQSEIVDRTDWAGATVSRTLSEMEERGEIHKISVGRENLVMLVGAEPDWYDPPREVDASGADGEGQSQAILMVEDNTAEARLFREALQEASISAEVHVVRDGSDAVEFLRRRGQYREAPRPSLVLLDLTLKMIDGFEVLRELRGENGAGAPVLVLSNSTDDDDIARAYAEGATAYLIKPDDFDERVRLASAIGEFWLQYTVPPAAVADRSNVARPPTDSRIE